MAMNTNIYNDLFKKLDLPLDYEESRVPILGCAKDQGESRMSWSIAVADTSAIGAYVKHPYKGFIPISANELFDCCYNSESTECYAWFMSIAFVRLKCLGGVPEYLWPFEIVKRKGRFRTFEEQQAAIHIGGYEFLPLNEINLMVAIEEYPIVAGIYITDEFAKLGKNDIYKPKVPPGKRIGELALHAVAVYGWGYDPIEHIHYWKFRNSYGNGWGNEGCGRIIRQSSATNGELSIMQPIRPTF